MASFDSDRWISDFFVREKKKGRAFCLGGDYCRTWVDTGEEILIECWWGVYGSIGYRRGEYPRTRRDWSGNDINLR